MRVKLIRRVTINGYTNPPPKGTVVEVSDEEGKALIGVGYAKATNEDITDSALLAVPGGNTAPPVSGIVEAPAVVADADTDASQPDYAAILSGTVADISATLAGEHGLDAKNLKALAKAEDKREGGGRIGVHAAIDKAAAALEGGE